MGVMDFDFFKNVVDGFYRIGVGAINIISRGEPTLHKKIKKLIMFQQKNIFEIKLNTNATFLSEEICPQFKK